MANSLEVDDELEMEVCEPVTSISHLLSIVEDPPEWICHIIKLQSRSTTVVQNVTKDCHKDVDGFVPKLRLDQNSVPKTLVCHDMMNGYNEDRYITPMRIGSKYTFYRWSQIDSFVYFSHKFVTIPPLCWINVAHKNGVKILGTLITEWEEGKNICDEILESNGAIHAIVDALVGICVLFKLDGWLLNVENKIKDPTRLIYFVKRLTEEMHRVLPHSLIIWYDSVTSTGDLAWQNQLNLTNRCFFDVCDGIFVNYSWNENHLAETTKFAQHRALDVYVGVDIFGRNMYGGGKFNTYKAAELIRKYNFSMALFAPGWTHETLNKEPEDDYLERFLDRDNALWMRLWPFLYTHPITTIFDTSFYLGVDKEWFKLSEQDLQLSRFLHPKELSMEFKEFLTSENSCSCMQLHYSDNHTHCFITNKNLPPLHSDYIHHLFTCDIAISGNVIVYFYTKYLEKSDPALNLVLLVRKSNGTTKKIICNVTKEEQSTEENCTLLKVCPSDNPDVVQICSYHNDIPKDWMLTCFVINFNSCKILEVGAQLCPGQTSVYLCGFGIKKATILNNL